MKEIQGLHPPRTPTAKLIRMIQRAPEESSSSDDDEDSADEADSASTTSTPGNVGADAETHSPSRAGKVSYSEGKLAVAFEQYFESATRRGTTSNETLAPLDYSRIAEEMALIQPKHQGGEAHCACLGWWWWWWW